MLAKILTVKLYQDCCSTWEHTIHVVMHGISLAEEDMWRKWDIIKAGELTSEYFSIISELCLLYSHSWAILILPTEPVKADIVVLSTQQWFHNCWDCSSKNPLNRKLCCDQHTATS